MTMIVYRTVRAGHQAPVRFRTSWKRFLKKTFALLVGYDKKEEINLTKEKTKWDLIYTH